MHLIKTGIAITIVPLLFFCILEISLLMAYEVTGSKYFATIQEQNIGTTNIDFADLKSDKLKIAVFGGSSAAGYGSPVSFAELIQLAHPEEVTVHNFATSGAPFVGFQSKKIQLVMRHYDVIIIYAGHNEIWSSLYLKSSRFGEKIEILGGNSINGVVAVKKRDQELLRLSESMRNYETPSNYPRFISSLRVANLARRAINLVAANLSKVSKKKSKQTLPYYSEQAVLSTEEKQEILKNFSSELSVIKQKLRKDQRLVVLSVLSNDYYPPNLGIYQGNNLDAASSKTKIAYGKLYTGGKLTYADLKSIPQGAHLSFLKGMLCLQRKLTKPEECTSLLREARNQDAMPYRVLPAINELIVKADDLFTAIDSEQDLPLDKSVLDFFVDFQHPSLLGHLFLANKILPRLGFRGNYSLVEGLPKFCETQNSTLTYMQGKSQRKDIVIKNQNIIRSIQMNISWLERQLTHSAVKFVHKDYLTRANNSLRLCSKPQNTS